MSEKTELEAKKEPSAIVELPLRPDVILDQFKAIQKFKESLIDKKTDVLEISGKPYILKSGWRKLSFAFNLSDEIVREEKETTQDARTIWRIWTKVTAPNGRSVVAVGSCSSSERKFTHPEADPYAMAATRSKNRAISDILGLGLVSAEEIQSGDETPIEAKNVIPLKQAEPKDEARLQDTFVLECELQGMPFPVYHDEVPFPSFFEKKILEGMRSKKNSEFSYDYEFGDDKSITEIHVRGASEDQKKELQKTLLWTLEHVSENRKGKQRVQEK